jgi:hypothetical protein
MEELRGLRGGKRPGSCTKTYHWKCDLRHTGSCTVHR